ncbi:hypothetical protein SAMN04490248_1152 [Salinihabitans flavidus]|uniref:Uncharacterized protein n=1 Tax=Salinihabitans flavidus TaxID=569882 RepID=A0A1H8TCG6_9RHOB|nr:hypothetical protein SAMN04490248_1152 [Salinihabitans flavidus]
MCPRKTHALTVSISAAQGSRMHHPLGKKVGGRASEAATNGGPHKDRNMKIFTRCLRLCRRIPAWTSFAIFSQSLVKQHRIPFCSRLVRRHVAVGCAGLLTPENPTPLHGDTPNIPTKRTAKRGKRTARPHSPATTPCALHSTTGLLEALDRIPCPQTDRSQDALLESLRRTPRGTRPDPQNLQNSHPHPRRTHEPPQHPRNGRDRSQSLMLTGKGLSCPMHELRNNAEARANSESNDIGHFEFTRSK